MRLRQDAAVGHYADPRCPISHATACVLDKIDDLAYGLLHVDTQGKTYRECWTYLEVIENGRIFIAAIATGLPAFVCVALVIKYNQFFQLCRR